MTKVKFFNDFQGVETNNVFYPAGEHDVPESVASRVVKDGRAEFVRNEGKVSPGAEGESVVQVVEVTESTTLAGNDTIVIEPLMSSKKFKRGK